MKEEKKHLLVPPLPLKSKKNFKKKNQGAPLPPEQ